MHVQNAKVDQECDFERKSPNLKASSVFEDSRGNRIRSLSMKVGAFSKTKTKNEILPVLVEATLALNIDMLGPNCFQGTKTTRSLNVPNHADGNQWRSFEDGDGLDDFTSSALGSGTFDFTDNVGHTGFEAEEGRKMDGLLGVILGEGLNLTAVAARALLRVESHRAMTRRRKLTMRL